MGFCAGLLDSVTEMENRASQNTFYWATPDACRRYLTPVSSDPATIRGDTIHSNSSRITSSEQPLRHSHQCTPFTSGRGTSRTDIGIDDDVLLPELRAFQKRLKF